MLVLFGNWKIIGIAVILALNDLYSSESSLMAVVPIDIGSISAVLIIGSASKLARMLALLVIAGVSWGFWGT